MKINELKINGFGKLKDREIILKDGINIVYGENESGKSSMLKFISGMLYGVSKNKNGKDISDFDRYKPWETETFSGKIKYTLDDGKSFEVYREFKKKNPIIYNENQEDISKQFYMDKTKGIDFFTEQTGIDLETFHSTAITEQEGIRLSQSSQNSIIQKISNLISSGDDNISYKKSLEKINKMQNEEVGTDRTTQRPINIVENKIYKLLEQKKALEIYRESVYDNSLQKEQLYLEEKDEEIKKEFLKEVKNKLDNHRFKNAEINFNRNLETQYDDKIDELNQKITQEERQESFERVSLKKYYGLLLLCIFVAIIAFVFYPQGIFKYVLLIPILISVGLIIYQKKHVKNMISREEKRSVLEKEKIMNEIEILRQSRETQRNEANMKQEKLNLEIEKENKELIEKYISHLDIGFMEENIQKNYDDILKEIEKKENRLNTIRFKIHTMENESKNIASKLDDLANIEEELENAENEKEELISLNNSYNIAKDCLEKAYEQVKANISPRFTENLCDIISNISKERYKKVIFNDADGLKIEIENGSYIPASRLSVGTIDQMYISLRLSALNEIAEETLPIILDEAFAYFDNQRLMSMLKYLKVNFPENQIIIFTCSNREIETFEHLNIEYNLINLEK